MHTKLELLKDMPIYLEYEYIHNSNIIKDFGYLLHFSLPTEDDAKTLASQMEEWSLEAKQSGNRVILSKTWGYDGKSYLDCSVSLWAGCSHTMGIQFGDSTSANEFYKFYWTARKNSKVKMPEIMYLNTSLFEMNNNKVTFPDLLQPNFSIENRVSAYHQIVKKSNLNPVLLHPDFSFENQEKIKNKIAILWATLQFIPLMPIELINLIALNIVRIGLMKSSGSLEVNKLFKVPENEQEFRSAYKKVNCDIQYSPPTKWVNHFSRYIHVHFLLYF